MKYLNSKNRIKSVVATFVSVAVFMSIAICMISAAPRNYSGEPQLTAAEALLRIESPSLTTTQEITFEESAVTTNKVYTIISDTPIYASPEVETTEAETTVEETTAEETTEAETTAAETTAVETTVETTAKEVTSSLPSGSLADELGVPYTIEVQKTEVSEEDIILTATVIQLEVMGNGSSLYRFEDVQEKYWEMLSVAQCIRNRAASRYFPSSPKGVIVQSHTTPSGKVIYQFSPAEKLARFTPTKEAVIAAREVLINGVTVLPSNYYYFCATRIEESFERGNAYSFVLKEDGTYDKIQGHLTTFYAGRP